MSHSERKRYGTGRSRSNRSRDRAQMHFDDLMIDDYLGKEDASDAHEREVVKVRYGVQRLAEYLSDSTIACEALRLEDEPSSSNEGMQLDVIDDAAPLSFASAAISATSDRCESTDRIDAFSVSGVLRGMAMGTAAGFGLLVVLRILT
ncbi:MAG: hypothetical protein GXP29_10050 [Planctomycetes bacterium]|nr:hypothetical protein [Planctomycetota bacterium]